METLQSGDFFASRFPVYRKTFGAVAKALRKFLSPSKEPLKMILIIRIQAPNPSRLKGLLRSNQKESGSEVKALKFMWLVLTMILKTLSMPIL